MTSLSELDQDPRAPAFVQDPYTFYAKARGYGPYFHWKQYGIVCCTSCDDINALLRDRRLGRQILHVATREELGWPPPDPRHADFDAIERHSLLELEPPEHTRLRGLVNRAFVSRRIERLRPRIAEIATGLIDRFPKGGVDLLQAYATPIPVIVIAELLGIDREHAPQLLDWSHRMVRMYQFGRTTEDELGAAAAAREFATFVRGEIAERRLAAPGDDLLSHLIRQESEEGRLSEDEIVTTTILLLNAGHEATVHAIANAVKAILESGLNPARMLADAASIEAAIEETLRYDPPLHMFTRYALEDLELEGGVRLARGERIGLLLGAANRDPARFHDPDRFDPARKPGPHVTFGAGIHFCLGAPLARLELAVALPILFQRLPRLHLASPPRYRDSYHFHGLQWLEVAW